MSARIDADPRRAWLDADDLDALLSAAPAQRWSDPALARLHSAGVLTATGPAEPIAPGLAAVTAPLCRLRLAARAASVDVAADGAQAWVGESSAALRVRRAGEPDEFIALRPQHLPDELADLVELVPRVRPRLQPVEVSRVWLADLLDAGPGQRASIARRLIAAAEDEAAHDSVTAIVRLRRGWTITMRWETTEALAPTHRVMLLDTDDGLWMALPDLDTTLVLPMSSGDVWLLLTQLLLDDSAPDDDRRPCHEDGGTESVPPDETT